MKNIIVNILKKIRNLFFVIIYKNEYKKQKLRRFNERPVEYAFVFKKISEIYPKTILDVGTGVTALPRLMRVGGSLVTAIDNIKDYWPQGMSNSYYYVIDDDITNTRLEETFDLITCISVLEHVLKYDAAVTNMVSLLNEKGFLILSFPYCEKQYVKNVYEIPGSTYGQNAPYITQAYSREQINKWKRDLNLEIISQEYWCFWSGEFWTVGNQIIPPKQVSEKDTHHITCILFQKK